MSTKDPTKDKVKSYQAALAKHVAAYSRATARLELAISRRAAIVADHDRTVAAAQGAVDETVASMAHALGADLTAALLDMETAEVRRLAKGKTAPSGETGER